MHDLPAWAVAGVPTILEQGQTVAREKYLYDSIDKSWLPVVWHLPVQQYPFIAVYDAQHLNNLERELVRRTRQEGGRILWVSTAE
jgi:hypothetical protein